MNIKLKRTLLATTIGAVLSSGTMAKEAESEENIEVIEVTGIMRSMEKAQDVKRESTGIVDAITAEGLGKFPDANIAESLQRIPGISIDRNGGEGQFVSVRGFGPSFNTVLVNGRRIVSETGGREFSFDLYPAELISGAQVYKSGIASLQEGGIGATINLETSRPLQVKDKIIVSAKALYDNDSDEMTPQLFGLVSKEFNDGKTGVLLSGVYQERQSQQDFSNTNGWFARDVDILDIAPNGNPGNVTTAFIPRETQWGRRFQTRERTNIQGIFQHDFSEDVRLTVDGFYNEYEVESTTSMMGSWFGAPGMLSNIVLSENGTVLQEDVTSEVGALQKMEGRPTKTKAIGFNLEWYPDDELESSFDFSYSDSEALQGRGNGSAVAGFVDSFSFRNDGSNIAELIMPQSVADRMANPDEIRTHVAFLGDQAGDGTDGNSVKADLYEFKFDNVYTPNDGELLDNIKFGALYSKESKKVDVRIADFSVFCMYCGFKVDFPNELLVTDWDNDGLLSGVSPNAVRNFPRFDINEFIGWATSDQGFAALDACTADDLCSGGPDQTGGLVSLPPGYTSFKDLYNDTLDETGGFAGRKQASSYEVEETIFSFYGEVTLQGEVKEMPWTLNTGARFIYTKSEAVGQKQILNSLTLTNAGASQYETTFTDGGFQAESNDYLNILPSFNFTLEPIEDAIVRFSFSESMTRPELSSLAPRFTYNDLRPGALTANGGNVNLKPYTSTNLDLSLEYYLDELSYVSLAVFKKEISDFIVIDSRTEVVNTQVNSVIDDPLVDETAGTANISVVGPVNSESADVKGLEFAFQYVFDFGLGFSANATFLDSNAQISENDSLVSLFAIEGLSDSKNASVFYENGPFEARVSWNQRDSFLSELVNRKAGEEPVFTDEYQQVDMRVTYNISEEYSVFFEGVNITDEKEGQHGRYEDQFMLYRTSGPRYALGVRGVF